MTSKTRSKQNEKVSEMERGELESLISNIVRQVMEPLSETIKNLTNEVSTFKKKLKEKDDKICKLEEYVETRLDELEQYGRRNNLRIFGVPEKQDENTDDIVLDIASKIGVDMDISYIDRCHRVGRKVPGANRPIIVKFSGYAVRAEYFQKKKQLRGTKTTVREDLTVFRLKVLKEAVKCYGVKRVWSRDGVIKINVGLSHPVGARTLQQLKDILQKFPPATLSET